MGFTPHGSSPTIENKLAKKLHPLQIPRPGKRILQTDANDEYWATALFEKKMMEGGIFVDIKVVHSRPQNSITIPRSKKYLQ